MDTQGFVVLRGVLPPETLQHLRDECDALCAALAASGIAVDDEAEACVVDVHRASPPAERAPARTERDAYVVARRAAVAACCGGGADVAARHAAVERVLFHTLPRALLDAACFEPGVQTLHLFNEQYVAKPAASRFSTFAWHRDAEEQLAMCVDVTATPYVSVWCPLDDCSVNNGTLVVKPGLEPWAPPQDGSSGAEGVPIELAAGGLVGFHSSLWHASSANTSASPRRVFYAQYSATPIMCGPAGQRSPLAFAVPVHG